MARIFLLLCIAATLGAQEAPAPARRPIALPPSATAPTPRIGVPATAQPAVAHTDTAPAVISGTEGQPAVAPASTALAYTSPTTAPDPRAPAVQEKPFAGSQNLPIIAALNPDEPVGPFLLVDETGPQALALLEQLTGKIILTQQTIPQVKLNFNSRGTLSRKDAVAALETLLSLNGIALVNLNDNFVKAVPAGGINTQSPEILTVKNIQDLPPSQTFYTRVFKLETLSPTEAAPLLQPMLTALPQGAATLLPFERAGAILVTDTLVNLQRMERVLQKIDIANNFDTTVVFVPLKYAKASEVVARLQRLQGGIFRRSMSGASTSFEADDRTNQLMIISQPDNIELLRKVVGGLDVDIDPLTRSEVFYIQQADAKELADVLKQVVTGQQQAAKQAQNQAQKNSQAALANRTNKQTKQTTKVATAASTAAAAAPRAEMIPNLFGDENNSFQFSQFVTIVPDQRANAIVVYGTPTDIKHIGGVIEKMDISRMQVRVEVVITEVTLTDNQVSGLENFSLSGVDINQSGWRVDAGGRTGSVNSASDPAFSFSLEDYTLDMVFNVAKRDSHVKVLSAPSITTTHNEKGSIKITEERPRITSSTTNTQASVGTNNQVTQEIDWIDIGITLRLEEIRVGPGGMIQMEITQTASDVIEYQTIADINTPIVSTREAQSFVTAKSGEVIVLGGLQSLTESKTDGRVFFWGEIPLLGNLFRPRTAEVRRRELIIFLRPVIVNSVSTSNTFVANEVKNSLAAEDLKTFYERGNFALPKELKREEERLRAENADASNVNKKPRPATPPSKRGGARMR